MTHGAVGLSLLLAVGCGGVASTVTSIVPGIQKKPEEKIKVGEKLHLNVSPEVALMLFQAVAEENGWEVKSAGDQRNIEGAVTGKFFRIETVQFVGGRRVMTGVFFKDKADDEISYVIMGKPGSEDMYGIPVTLVDKMRTAVAEWTGETEDSMESDPAVADSELSPLDEVFGSAEYLESDSDREPATGFAAGTGSESEFTLDTSPGDDLEKTELLSLEDGKNLDLDAEPNGAVFDDMELSPEEEEIIEAIDLSQ